MLLVLVVRMVPAPSSAGWTWILLAYAWLASVLPVWSLLQSRDFLNSLLLYLGLGLAYIGFFTLDPEFAGYVSLRDGELMFVSGPSNKARNGCFVRRGVIR